VRHSESHAVYVEAENLPELFGVSCISNIFFNEFHAFLVVYVLFG
jgi:hypothetical protein